MNFAKAIKMSNKSNDYIYRKNDHDQRRYNIFFFSFFTRGDPDKETSLLPMYSGTAITCSFAKIAFFFCFVFFFFFFYYLRMSYSIVKTSKAENDQLARDPSPRVFALTDRPNSF